MEFYNKSEFTLKIMTPTIYVKPAPMDRQNYSILALGFNFVLVSPKNVLLGFMILRKIEKTLKIRKLW